MFCVFWRKIRHSSFIAAGTFNVEHQCIKDKHPPTNQCINIVHYTKQSTHTHVSTHIHSPKTHTWNAIKNICNQVRMHVFTNLMCERRKDRNVCLRQHHDHHLRFYFVTGAFGDRLMYWDRQYSRKPYDGGYTIKTSLCV